MSIQQAISDLSQVLGDRVTTSKSDLDLHGRNETYFPHMPPDAVAYPESTEQVAQILRICAEQKCPVVAWGTGTSLEGHSLPLNGGITVDFSRMNKILAVNAEDMDAVVQPGVTREALNTDLRATGLFFSVDPGANAALGGMAATSASGTTAVRYGTMRDNVLALEVVTADGKIIRTGTRARKTSAGYDLTGLFVGSEGTLGLITELTLKLHGVPEATSAAMCAFDTMEIAVDTVMATIQMGIPMARIEFIDEATVVACNAYAGMDFPAKPHLMVEFHGSENSATEDAQRFGEIVSDMGGAGFRWSARAEERSALWAMRHNAYYAVLGSRPGSRAVTTDVCVPVSRLAKAVDDTRKDMDASSVPGAILGHVGDGNYHTILLVDPDNKSEEKEAKALAHRMAERALALGGTVTGEHGVGMGKLDFMEAEHGAAWGVMGQLKRTLDPHNILNPGKVVRQNG